MSSDDEMLDYLRWIKKLKTLANSERHLQANNNSFVSPAWLPARADARVGQGAQSGCSTRMG